MIGALAARNNLRVKNDLQGSVYEDFWSFGRVMVNRIR